MKTYLKIALGCAAIPSILFLLFAPEEWHTYTLCLFGVLSLAVVGMFMILTGEANNDN